MTLNASRPRKQIPCRTGLGQLPIFPCQSLFSVFSAVEFFQAIFRFSGHEPRGTSIVNRNGPPFAGKLYQFRTKCQEIISVFRKSSITHNPQLTTILAESKDRQRLKAGKGELVRPSSLAERNKPLNVKPFLQKMISTQPNNLRTSALICV